MERVNSQIADKLAEVAQILEAQRANNFRVAAYRHAAAMLRGLKQPVDEILRTEGLEGLRKLPGIGETLARFIYQLVKTGRLPMLDRLRGESDSITVLRSVPGIGKVTAQRLHDELGIETLEELEVAAYDGRLTDALGFKDKRLAGIRDCLAMRLGRVRSDLSSPERQPSVNEILDVDNEYRTKAAGQLLPRIAPRRLNPEHARWLPILHTKRGRRHYSAMFSNTARAHLLNKTADWVVIYYDRGDGERQCTVVTSTHGPLEGLRIIRGREQECHDFYKSAEVRKKVTMPQPKMQTERLGKSRVLRM